MILSDNETKFDLLNNEAIAKTVVNLIKESNNQPISIGIHGDWGAGKSSILGIIAQRIMEKGNFENKPDGIDGLRILVQQKNKIPPNRILIETDAPFSGEFKNAKQLKNILQDMIDNISMIKGIDLKKYLIHNEETVFAY